MYQWNDTKELGTKWDPVLMKQLQMRYEEPNSDTRWDSLFTILSEDPQEKIPIEDIWNALV